MLVGLLNTTVKMKSDCWPNDWVVFSKPPFMQHKLLIIKYNNYVKDMLFYLNKLYFSSITWRIHFVIQEYVRFEKYF